MLAAELSKAGKSLLSTETLAAREQISVPWRGDLKGGAEGPKCLVGACPQGSPQAAPQGQQSSGFRSLEGAHKGPGTGFSPQSSRWKQIIVRNP